ncbi:MAG TPA: hypothetical protein VEC18_00755, partial [Myxococcota bacterium]|nr:hypothetical protein [Myxococcota bacterium]
DAIESMNSSGLDALLASIHGDAAAAYVIAGRSYLASGHYEAAHRALAEAIARGGDRDEIAHLSAYARGMSAYLAGQYSESLVGLSEWADARNTGDDSLREIAHCAVSSLARLVEGSDRECTLASASSLLGKLRAASGPHAAARRADEK